MARIPVGGTATVDQLGKVATPGASAVLYLTRLGGTPIADVIDEAGAAIPGGIITIPADGIFPLVRPEVGALTAVWVSVNGGPRQWLPAHNSVAGDAGVAELIGNTATETRQALSKLVPSVSVLDFGAVGDGVADDTAAINAAVAYAAGRGLRTRLLFPAGPGYRTTSTISVPGSIDLEMESPIVYAGSGAALVVGEIGAGRTSRALHNIRARRDTPSAWTDESIIGVRLINHYWSEVHVHEVTSFTIGVQCLADAGGFVYNKIHLGRIAENQVGVDLDAINAGWVNENTFFGGGFTNGTDTNPSIDRVGVRITSSDGSYVNNNSNVFYSPSFEIKSPGPGVGTCVLAVHAGMGNRFLDCRHEAVAQTAVITRNASWPILFTTSYNTGVLAYDPQGDYAGTTIKEARRWTTSSAKRMVYETGPLRRNACYYDSTGRVHVPGVAIIHSTQVDGTYPRFANSSGLVTLQSDHLSIATTGMAGVLLSTENVREFVVAVDALGDAGGRLMIRCYNAAGALVSTAGSVKSDRQSMVYMASYGGIFRTGSDSSGDRFFRVSEEVHSVFVGIGGGSSPALLRSFAIYSIGEGGAATWLPWFEDGQNVGTGAPTSGTWERGRRVINVNPAPGSPQGWVCTTAGDPGTWTAMPSL